MFLYTSSPIDHTKLSCKFSNNCHLPNSCSQNVSLWIFLKCIPGRVPTSQLCILKVYAGIKMGIFELKYPKVYLNHDPIFDQLAVSEFMQLVLKVQWPILAIFSPTSCERIQNKKKIHRKWNFKFLTFFNFIEFFFIFFKKIKQKLCY